MLIGTLLGVVAAMPVAGAPGEPSPFLYARALQAHSLGAPSGELRRGTLADLVGQVSKCTETVPGCPFSLDRSSLYFRLPPGIRYVSHSAPQPIGPAVSCSTADMPDDSQHVSCIGSSLVGFSWAVNHNGQITLRVSIDDDAPLGSTRLVMAIDDVLPENSATLAECLGDSIPDYCIEVNASTVPAPEPELVVSSFTHSPAVFVVDDTASRIHATLRNIGTASTESTHFKVSLPPGLQWQLSSTTVTGLMMTCSSASTFTVGQTVTCSGGALAPTTAGGGNIVTVALGIRPRDVMEFPGPIPVVAALHDSDDNAVLLACAADPSPAHCAWLDVPTWIPCAHAHGADGVYCDGFELPGRPDHD